jgi:adenine-specific DNA-methyltransferase
MILAQVEKNRKSVSLQLNSETKSELGQFFTPSAIASFMASLFNVNGEKEINILDAGAGVGSLSAALLDRLAAYPLEKIDLTAYELDKQLLPHLKTNLDKYRQLFDENFHVEFLPDLEGKDFIVDSVLRYFSNTAKSFDFAILNPPYKKINSDSAHRRLLRKMRIETVNLYPAFVALALKLLKSGGQVVAIIPRSFCNGSYYKSFRQFLLREASIEQIHLFEARDKAFGEDGVLQENLIIHLSKHGKQGDVTISTSLDGNFTGLKEWNVPFNEVVRSDDPELFIHIPHHEPDEESSIYENFRFTLEELDIQVSTGPVVDFRLKDHLLKSLETGAAPLLYPAHLDDLGVKFPIENFKKFNAIKENADTLKYLYPSGFYTVVKRFTSKEEKKRIVARVVRPDDVPGKLVGFENHLNVFHHDKLGIPEDLAFGIAAYLNASVVDTYFRQFSGHTQVNATDLRRLKYPSLSKLLELGQWAKSLNSFEQKMVDAKVETL